MFLTPKFKLMLILKKTQPLFFALIASFSLFFAGCENAAKQQIDFSIPEAHDIVKKYNEGKLDFEQGEYLRGPVKVKIHKENGGAMVDFHLIGDKSLHYILQIYEKDNIFEETELEKAEVIFVRRSIVINSLTSSYRVFATVDKNEKIYEPLKSIDDITHDIYVIGIIMEETSGEIDLRIDRHCKCCTYRNGEIWGCGGTQGGGPGSGSCDSGGYGALSCSISVEGGSCSVSCNEDTHACCRSE
jgi:hypothetical protein